jgi:nitrate/nitrite-specific signal transduction histidine kinase/PAS domain-containing protein
MNTQIKLRLSALASIMLLMLAILRTAGLYNTDLNLYTPAFAQSSGPAISPTLTLTDAQGQYPLGLYMSLFEDPSASLSIEQASSPAYAARFIPSRVETPSYPPSDSTYWVRLHLDNRTRQTNKWLLEVNFANMHYVDLYTPLPDSGGFEVKQTGTLRPPSTRDIQHPRIVFDLTIPPGGQQLYYLRFQSSTSMTLGMTLWTRNAFADKTILEQWLVGIFFGILFGLLAYNLFLLLSMREKSYLYFVTMLACAILHQATYLGYSEIYLAPDLYAIKQFTIGLFFALMIASMLLFSDAFLDIRAKIPWLHKANLLICASLGITVAEITFVNYTFVLRQALLLALVSLGGVWAAGIITWRRGARLEQLFLVAWLGMTASVIMTILVRLGVLPSNTVSESLYQAGLVWAAVCWSIALAHRINLLKAETEIANRGLRHSEYRLSQILNGLPLGVILLGKDQKLKYANQRTGEIFAEAARGIQADAVSASWPEPVKGQPLEAPQQAQHASAGQPASAQGTAVDSFPLQIAGSRRPYPPEHLPVHSALRGVPASADDIEFDRGGQRIPLEVWASPIRNDAGEVESAVVTFQDISQRKQTDAELAQYHRRLEALVEERTAELSAANELLHRHIQWLSAVNQVNQFMASSADFQQIYDKILDITNHLFSAQNSFIGELEAPGQQMKIMAHSCCSRGCPGLVGSLTTLPEPFLSNPEPWQSGTAIYLEDQLNSLDGPLGQHLQAEHAQTLVLAPLCLRETQFGFLGLEIAEKGRTIRQEEAALLNILTTDIAQLIENSRLYQQAKQLIAVEERSRLAQDLHDSVTQVLFSANLLAEVLPQIWRSNPERGLQRLEKLRRLTRGALAEMRTLLLELRPAAVVKTPLEDLLAQLTEASGIRAELSFQLYLERIPLLPQDVQISFYRIAQEALNNIIKHAQANLVTISLSAAPLPMEADGKPWHEIRLAIEDDGVGFASENKGTGHMGIGIMRERAAAIQAHLNLESQPGHGTQVMLIWHGETGSQE